MVVLKTLFRWIVQCVEEHQLNTVPLFTREWINVRDENTMYSSSLLERKVSTWEANVCPWWLDYPLGIIPKQEIELRESKCLNTYHSFSLCYNHFIADVNITFFFVYTCAKGLSKRVKIT